MAVASVLCVIAILAPADTTSVADISGENRRSRPAAHFAADGIRRKVIPLWRVSAGLKERHPGRATDLGSARDRLGPDIRKPGSLGLDVELADQSPEQIGLTPDVSAEVGAAFGI